MKQLYLDELHRIVGTRTVATWTARLMTAWKSVVGTDDTMLNGSDGALAGSLGESGRAGSTRPRGRKILVVGNHDFNRRTGLLDVAGHGVSRLEPWRSTPICRWS